MAGQTVTAAVKQQIDARRGADLSQRDGLRPAALHVLESEAKGYDRRISLVWVDLCCSRPARTSRRSAQLHSQSRGERRGQPVVNRPLAAVDRVVERFPGSSSPSVMSQNLPAACVTAAGDRSWIRTTGETIQRPRYFALVSRPRS